MAGAATLEAVDNTPKAEAPIQAFTVTLNIRRFDPEKDAEPYWQDFDVELYATDAVLEDPVGGEVHIGHQAIRNFYSATTGLQCETELVTLRVAGNEAAFHFALTITNGDHRMRIEPIDVMVFDGDGKIAGMKAYWSAENITQL